MINEQVEAGLAERYGGGSYGGTWHGCYFCAKPIGTNETVCKTCSDVGKENDPEYQKWYSTKYKI